MAPIRTESSKILISKIKDLCDKNISILDVGCAAGWFMQEALAADMSAVGVDPNIDIAKNAISNGLNIRNGYFPDCIKHSEKFDVISFNDVFEHLPDPRETLSNVKHHLNKNGVLLLNLPNTDGIFYRFSSILCKIGSIKMFERMWQKNYESPHLFYFNRKNLRALVENSGFYIVEERTLPSIHLHGLWSRIHDSQNKNWIYSLLIYICILVLFPLFHYALPKDILVQFYKLSGGNRLDL